MRRVGYLFEQIADLGALIEATRRAAKGSQLTEEAAAFCADIEPNCLSLRRELINGHYHPGPLRTFLIHQPKPRLISAAPFRDRVIHHALCAALEPQLDKQAIHHSYACRPNKGLHKAIDYAHTLCKTHSTYLKLDIHHYFETIDHTTLKQLLRRRFKDQRLLTLCDTLIDHGAPGSPLGKGLPIGNLTSQHLANFYLSYLDRHIKQDLKISAYLRYMDDMLIFANDLNTLREWRAHIDHHLTHTLKLTLKQSAERLDWTQSGVPFLGLRLTPDRTRFDKSRQRRLRAHLKHLTRLPPHTLTPAHLARAASIYSWAKLARPPSLLQSWHRTWTLNDDP